MTHDKRIEQFEFSQLVRALGQPLLMSPLAQMATIGIRPQQVGSASALFNMMGNLGGSVGIAMLSTTQALAEMAQMVRREAYVMAYADCFMLIGLALTLAIPGVFLLSRARPGEGGAAH